MDDDLPRDDLPRVVCDTSVFLQATISRRGPAARLLKLFDDRQYILVASEALVDEIRDVLTRPIIRRTNPHYTNEDIERVLSRLHNNTLFVSNYSAYPH